MREKIRRFIQAYRMNGVVKKKTLVIASVALTLIILAILLLCLRPRESDTPNEPEEIIQNDAVEPEELFEPIVEPEDMEKTMKKYPDVYAWIEMPGTSDILRTKADVSYPVAQHPTQRSFYLNHDLDGNWYQPGTLFTEAMVEGRVANSRDLNDPVTVIYGHNMANRTMFGGMQTYVEKLDLTEENLVYLYQKDRRLTYRIVGGVMYGKRHILYYNDFADSAPSPMRAGLTQGDDIFDDFFGSLWSGIYDSTHVDPDNMPVHGDRVLILLTCDNNTGNDDYRYLTICKLIEDTDVLKAKAAKALKPMD